MYKPRTRDLIYFAGERRSEQADAITEEELGRVLSTIGRQVIRERVPGICELEAILQRSLEGSTSGSEDRQQAVDEIADRSRQASESQESDDGDGSDQITKFLLENGYIRDEKRWLTDKGFLLVGYKLLLDALQDMETGEPGTVRSRRYGDGDTITDTTKRFEPGADIAHLDAAGTLLNTVLRLGRGRKEINFPLEVTPEDMVERERLADIRTAIVYCIDLSSTMRYRLAGGPTRVEAAKTALWSLYTLNRRYFPANSVHIVGFASLASMVRPQDIPYLKTYTARDGFLHYTNYQAALRMAASILTRTGAQDKRIMLITDGQPSACLVDDERQHQEIISEKPYSKFYAVDDSTLSKIRNEKDMIPDSTPGSMVYLCYRYKKVEDRINQKTLQEARRCLAAGIRIDSIVVSDEEELLEYVSGLEAALRGRVYHVRDPAMDRILISDYMTNARRILRSAQNL